MKGCEPLYKHLVWPAHLSHKPPNNPVINYAYTAGDDHHNDLAVLFAQYSSLDQLAILHEVRPIESTPTG